MDAAATNAPADLICPVPADWTRRPDRPGRLATWKVPGLDAEATLILLPGRGGGVEANGRRFLSQMQVTPLAARWKAWTEALRLEETPAGGQLALLDLTGFAARAEDPAVVAASVAFPQGTAVLRLVGPRDRAAALVGAVRQAAFGLRLADAPARP